MFANGPTIVTNGLVLALDAGDKNSYISGSTTWFDLTGVNNGTLTNGPTFNSGSGGSIVFDGTNDYVITTSGLTPSLNITTSITLETWLRSTALADITHADGINSKGRSSDNNTGVYETLLIQSSSINTPLFRIRIGSSTPTYNPNTPMILNQIYHFVSTYDGNTMRIFINGIEIETGLATSGTIENNTEQLTIGTRFILRGGGGFDSFFSGNLFSNKIYNRALTASEVLQNYNATKGRFGLT
jgi:hypothetical protein